MTAMVFGWIASVLEKQTKKGTPSAVFTILLLGKLA